MQFKINNEMLMNSYSEAKDEVSALEALKHMSRAILYFLEVGQFTINDEVYNNLSDDGKKYFIGVKE